MSQSCETLITKINEWQKAVLELEKLSDEFLNMGDEKIKPEIESKKQEIMSCQTKYQELAYPELPNGENLFWPEKEALEEFFNEKWGIHSRIYFDILIKVVKEGNIHVLKLGNWNLETSKQLNLILFQNLKELQIGHCKIKKLPNLPESIRRVFAWHNPGLELGDLTYLKNLNELFVSDCKIKKLPIFPKSIKRIVAEDNPGLELGDLTYLKNLNKLFVNRCGLTRMPSVNSNVTVYW